jgi:fermentation-respiration switch protein FrsA (DUF1100 family)
MVIVAALAGVYVVAAVLVWALQERITFPAPRGSLPDPQDVVGEGERVELHMRDGTRLVGWYLPPHAPRARKATHPGMLWFYGNGETIGAIWPIIRDFRPAGAGLLVIDYPGYGASDGRTTEDGLYEAADLAYGALAARPEIDRRRIYVYGRSLGSAPATHLAASADVAGLILESPFTSARDMAARHYRIFPTFLVRLRLDNLSRIQRSHCPVLVFHGTVDMIAPVEMGRRLAAAASGPGEFVAIEGAGHNETYDIGGTAYREKLANFVR